MLYAGHTVAKKYLGGLRWETLNPLRFVWIAELSSCVKAMGEANRGVTFVLSIVYSFS